MLEGSYTCLKFIKQAEGIFHTTDFSVTRNPQIADILLVCHEEVEGENIRYFPDSEIFLWSQSERINVAGDRFQG